MEYIKFLTDNCHIFRDKTPEELEKLLEDKNPLLRSYSAGAIIQSQADEALFLGIILQGQVAVKKNFSTGRTVTLASFGPGQVLGESVLFSGRSRYPADLIAREESVLLFLPRQDLLHLFHRDQDIMLRYMESISRRVLLLSEKIELLSLGTIRQKLAYYLLGQAEKKGGPALAWEFSRSELADFFNVPRPSLSRELSRLQQQGLIQFDQQGVQIIDPEGLEELLWD